MNDRQALTSKKEFWVHWLNKPIGFGQAQVYRDEFTEGGDGRA